jgi:hypothetical protein
MTRGIATADALLLRRGNLSTIALLIGATIVAWKTATWIADLCSPASDPMLKEQLAFFDQRFPQDLKTSPSLSLVRALSSELEVRLQSAKNVLAQRLLAASPPAAREEATAVSVPVPRPRPVEAMASQQSSEIAQADAPALLQKLAELLRPRITLASLTPGDAVSSDRLASLGYDSLTAVYDISAHTIYMPNGYQLEAHSGFGTLKDDPRHVDERDVGATPPAVYHLMLRERKFHGVQALRMIPKGRNNMRGRSGLLAHSYMLGPNGDSNGCVSIKDYEMFLGAFQNGEVKHLLVVTNLPDLVL